MGTSVSHVSLAIGYYSLCSSTLLIINKVALHVLPAPVSLLSVQFWFVVVLLYAIRASGLLQIQPLTWPTAAEFAPVVTFLGTLFCNAKVLQFSNVETFITFRSSTPLILSVCDYLLLGRQLPSRRSVLSMMGVLASCVGYAVVDHAFDVRAYSWLAAWFVCFTAYEVVVKMLCDNVLVGDNWTRVVYTNIMAGTMLGLTLPFATRERVVIASTAWSVSNASVIFASCVVGMGVSHSAYLMRSECSATLSAVVGILCKVITVTINMLIWDNHADRVEVAFLAMALASGMFYEQAPARLATLGKKAAQARAETDT